MTIGTLFVLFSLRFIQIGIGRKNNFLQCRTQGGPEGHVPPPPPEEAKKKDFFFHVLLKEKVGVTDRAVTPACR